MRSQGASPGTRETDHGILVERQRLAAEDYHTQFHDEPIRKYVEDVMQEVRPCPPTLCPPTLCPPAFDSSEAQLITTSFACGRCGSGAAAARNSSWI